MKYLSRLDTDSAHRRTGKRGKTWTVGCATVPVMRRVLYEGQTPLPLQGKAAKKSSPQSTQRVLGLSSYQTARAMLHRFRSAMVRPQRDKLAGTVEVDEACLPLSRDSRVKSGKTRSKAHNNFHLVAIAVAVQVHDSEGFRPIRIHRAKGQTIGALIPFVRENVMPSKPVFLHSVEKQSSEKPDPLYF